PARQPGRLAAAVYHQPEHQQELTALIGRRPMSADLPESIDRYPGRGKLGQGAFGVVYLGYHPFLERGVRIKVLRAQALTPKTGGERFLRKGKIVGKMDHPNILRVYDAGKWGDCFYIVSAYIPGRDLSDVIEEGGLDPRRAAGLVIQLAEALAYAHSQGLV